MSAERLVKEFGAQDVGAWLQVHSKGQHIRVAKWVDGAGWVPTEDGAKMLGGIDVAPNVEPATDVFHRRGRQKKVDAVPDILGDDE